MTTGSRWTGVTEAMDAIRGLNELASAEVLGDVLKTVGKPIAEEMGAACPRDTGLTADNFGVSLDQDAGEGTVRLHVGARGGKRGRAFIVRFIEYGTASKPARPFMRPISEGHRGSYEADVVKALQPSYERVVRRLARFARSRGAK